MKDYRLRWFVRTYGRSSVKHWMRERLHSTFDKTIERAEPVSSARYSARVVKSAFFIYRVGTLNYRLHCRRLLALQYFASARAMVHVESRKRIWKNIISPFSHAAAIGLQLQYTVYQDNALGRLALMRRSG